MFSVAVPEATVTLKVFPAPSLGTTTGFQFPATLQLPVAASQLTLNRRPLASRAGNIAPSAAAAAQTAARRPFRLRFEEKTCDDDRQRLDRRMAHLRRRTLNPPNTGNHNN